PFYVVAKNGGSVLNAMGPLDLRNALGRVDNIAANNQNRNAITVGVVDRHRGVLQADGTVSHDEEGLALNFGIAVCHADGRFFVAAGDELGTAIATIVDNRFVKASKAGARIGADIINA